MGKKKTDKKSIKVTEDVDKKAKEIEENTKKAQKDIFMGYAPYLIIIAFVIIIRMFIATPVKVNGTSMYPTLESNDTMILYKLTKHFRGIKRFDIVVISTDSGKLIKRVIGLPGETISYRIEKDENDKEIGVLYVDGEVVEEDFIENDAKVNTCAFETDLCTSEVTLGEDEYFVMGDNRGNSKDSRMIGSITKDDIMGTTQIIIFPFKRFGKVD